MRYRSFIGTLAVCVLLVVAAAAQAAVKLPAIIGDGMVLQRGQPVPIWGWADKGEEVTVTIGTRESLMGRSADGLARVPPRVGRSMLRAIERLVAHAGDDGRWKVTFKELSVGQPLEMIVKGKSGKPIFLKDILVGEVWVCSGQSNMEMGVGGCNDAAKEIAAANYPRIRLFTVEKVKAAQPATDVKGKWAACTPQTVGSGGWGGFSATAYFFGRELYKDLKVPIGLIHTSWGGTPAEFWISRKALEANPALKPLAQGEASCLYNGMIAPLIPFVIRGAIWYQGESNVGAAYRYRTLFPAMIANWRADWGEGKFPFGFVQIAPYNYHRDWKVDPACCPELWEAQLLTLKSTPHTGMAVTTDIAGDLNDIHPKAKQEVGRRLALWALAQVYGHKLVYSGPIYKSMAIEGGKIRLRFDHCGGGLAARDGKPLSDFTIAAADKKFVPAVATIDGDSIVVHSNKVPKPVAVRFGWRDDATPNLANKEGLPASPFRTDHWKGVTEGR